MSLHEFLNPMQMLLFVSFC